MEGYESAMGRHVLPAWGGREVGSVTPDEVQAWVDGFDRPGAAEKAVKTIRQVHRWCARRLGLAVADPTAGVVLPRKPAFERPVLSAREEREMLRGIWGAPFEAVVLCAAALGLRRCEACALEWGDVDFRSGRVRVSRGAHDVRGGTVVTPTKTARSDRALVLPAFALRRLRQIAGGRRCGRMCAMGPGRLARAFRSWCRARGLPWVPMTSLRHTWATLQVARGTPLADVALCLGHSTPETCYRHYLVRTSEVCRRAARAFEAALVGG